MPGLPASRGIATAAPSSHPPPAGQIQNKGDRPMTQARFSLGRIVATPGALRALEEAGQTPLHFLSMHANGEWGELGRDDREANERAIAHEDGPEHRDRILSSYVTSGRQKLWVITEHDRSVTTLLLP